MTFFSAIRINPLRAASRTMLANPRAIHGAVLGGLAEYSPSERTLWRLDEPTPRRPVLLVVTESKPDWSHIVEQAGWPDADVAHTVVRDYDSIVESVAAGRQFAFRVTANPVHNVGGRGAGRDTVRTGLRDREAQLEWFTKRAERWGFTVIGEPCITASRRLEFTKGRSGRKVTLTTAAFEGHLQVTDAAAMTHTLRTGLGPAKAYGCGLLILPELLSS